MTDSPKPPQHPIDALFSGSAPPDYSGFAYCSCVVGMTSQVSDVQAPSKHMRPLTLDAGHEIPLRSVTTALSVHRTEGYWRQDDNLPGFHALPIQMAKGRG